MTPCVVVISKKDCLNFKQLFLIVDSSTFRRLGTFESKREASMTSRGINLEVAFGVPVEFFKRSLSSPFLDQRERRLIHIRILDKVTLAI